MSEKSQIAFMGEIQKAQCECHKGQYLVLIFMVHPRQGKIYLHNVPFKTKAEAEKELQKCVELAAEEAMGLMGVRKDSLRKVEVSHNDDAVKAEKKFFNEHNPKLH